MSSERIFVGRIAELKQFDQVLREPQGQAVLVVGQQGMGKTMLVNRMAGLAKDHPDLRCGAVRYEVTPTDSVDATMSGMLDHAFEAATRAEGWLRTSPARLEQWRTFLNVFQIGDMAMSLHRDPQKSTRDQFVHRLHLISERLPKNGRAVFVIDPEKYMPPGSADDWRLVLRDLPDGIKFVFAQRLDDVLVANHDFNALTNLVRIPDTRLDVLDDKAMDDLLQLRTLDLKIPSGELRAALARYNRHPYAVQAALDLLVDGAGVDDLPADPTPESIGSAQWHRIAGEHGETAIRMFEAYAVLAVPVPDTLVEAVGGLTPRQRKSLLAHDSVTTMLRNENGNRRIYHSLLADHVFAQLSDQETRFYHGRAVEEFRRRLSAERKPDPLAAQELPRHVLALEGADAYVNTVIEECAPALITIGLLDEAMSILMRARDLVENESPQEADVLAAIGVINETRGDLDTAQSMQLKSLEINEKLGRLEGMASDYGNLGNNLYTRGDVDGAEAMYRKALQIDEKLGRLESMATAHGNLGIILKTRGDLEGAEAMHRKSLAINEKLGRIQGMANQYGNLGIILKRRGDLEGAEAMYRKALQIDEKLGRVEGMADQYGNLGIILETRGDLDGAEAMYRKSLAIFEKLGRLEGMAQSHGNLGTLFAERRDPVSAREHGEKARDLYQRIGIPHMVGATQAWIDELVSEHS